MNISKFKEYLSTAVIVFSMTGAGITTAWNVVKKDIDQSVDEYVRVAQYPGNLVLATQIKKQVPKLLNDPEDVKTEDLIMVVEACSYELFKVNYYSEMGQYEKSKIDAGCALSKSELQRRSEYVDL